MLNKILDISKRNYKYILFILVLIIINCFTIRGLANNHNVGNLLYIITIIVNILLIVLYAFLFKKIKNKELNKIYLIITIPLSILYMLIFPVGTTPDEGNHFLRAYEVSKGYVVSAVNTKNQNNLFSKSIDGVHGQDGYKNILKKLTTKNIKPRTIYAYQNTALYSFICYIPQATGVFIGNLFNLPVFALAYLGRIFNLIAFIMLSYYAIKLMPIKKMAMMIVLLFPIVMQQSITLSADALTISMSAFLIAYIMHLKSDKVKEISKKNIIVLSIASIVLSYCKIVYLPICLLVFLIPKDKFKTKKRGIITLSSIVAACIILNVLWLSISAQFLPQYDSVNSGEQLKYVLGNIFNYIHILYTTYETNIINFVNTSVGSSLGTFTITISIYYVITLVILYIYACFFNNYDITQKNNTINKIDKVFMSLIIIGTVLLISTSLYLQWTPVGKNIVDGIQGRYFLPLYFILPLLSLKMKIMPKMDINNKYIYLLLITINIYALASAFYYYV